MFPVDFVLYDVLRIIPVTLFNLTTGGLTRVLLQRTTHLRLSTTVLNTKIIRITPVAGSNLLVVVSFSVSFGNRIRRLYALIFN